MAELKIRKVDRWHQRKLILDGLSFRAPTGRITVLLSDDETVPRTVLKVIAGIEKANDGTILIDGSDITQARTRDRDVATIFRSSALMPHKSAYDNIAYPLKLASFDKPTIETRVTAAADHFGLVAQLGLRPKKLSELQRYQIGVARALVRDPSIYLFERPAKEYATLLDVAITEMRRLRDEFGRTVVYATDSVDEARDVADWIVVIHDGRRFQQGSPRRLVERPASRFIAGLFGATLKTVRVTDIGDAGITVQLKDGMPVFVPGDPAKASVGDDATLGIWPEHVQRDGGNTLYPAEHCHLFNEKGRAIAGKALLEAEARVAAKR
jgi:ABC-type sugar transport system ATPase subunit